MVWELGMVRIAFETTPLILPIDWWELWRVLKV
jgi:hypothetical protein